jgi:hypothetical protein
MQPLKILTGAIALSALTACATSGIHNSPTMQQLYAVQIDPLNHWPNQDQEDISKLQQDFVSHYQTHYPSNDVASDYAELTICELPQAQALDVAGIGPDMVNPKQPSDNVKGESTVTYESMVIRSTTAGCSALQNVEMHVVPNMVVNIKRLPDDFPHPVYMAGSYTKHTKNKVNINGRWRNSDLGIARVSVKRYRTSSDIDGFPYQQTSWEHSQTIKQGDVNLSRFQEKPMFIVSYFSTTGPEYKNITLFRQTLTNKTGNNITMRWEENDSFMSRTWLRNGTIMTQKNGKQNGLFVVPMAGKSSLVYCKDNGASVSYFRLNGDYDCIAANETEFGQDGVYMDPILSIQKGRAQPATPAIATRTPASAPPATSVSASASTVNTATPDNASNVVTDTASECSKAYAARKACEKLPGDPFGLALKLCLSQVKKNFGGMDCPMSF